MTQDWPRANRTLIATGSSIQVPSPISTSAFYKAIDSGWSFRLLNLTNDRDGNAYLLWSSEAEGTYRVVRATSLTGASANVIASNLAGFPPANNYTDLINWVTTPGPFYYWVEEVPVTGGLRRTANAGGILRVQVPFSNQLYMFHNPFDRFDGLPSYLPSWLLHDELPTGSTTFFWDVAATGYVPESYTHSGWTPDTNQFPRSVGFWVGIRTQSFTNVYFTGEVPDSYYAPTTTIGLVSGKYNLIGFPYPMHAVWTNTALASNAVVNEHILQYSPLENVYKITTRTPTGWSPATLVITQGASFFYFARSTNAWVQPKPYTWP